MSEAISAKCRGSWAWNSVHMGTWRWLWSRGTVLGRRGGSHTTMDITGFLDSSRGGSGQQPNGVAAGGCRRPCAVSTHSGGAACA